MDSESIHKIRLILQGEASELKGPLDQAVSILARMEAELQKINTSLASFGRSGASNVQAVASATQAAVIPTRDLATETERLGRAQSALAEQRYYRQQISLRTGVGGEYANIPRDESAPSTPQHRATLEDAKRLDDAYAANQAAGAAALKRANADKLASQKATLEQEKVLLSEHKTQLKAAEDIEAAHLERMAAFNARRARFALSQKQIAEDARIKDLQATNQRRVQGIEAVPSGGTLGNMAHDVLKVAEWTVATGAVFGTIAAIKEGIETYAEFEKATVSLARAGTHFGNGMKEQLAGARQVSEGLMQLKIRYGETGDSAFRAAAQFARMGQTQDQVLTSTQAALTMAVLTGESVEEAGTHLAATMGHFRLSANEAMGVVDKLNYIQNTTRTSADQLLQAVSRTGYVWQEAGGNLTSLASAVGVVMQVTGRSGSEVGNAFKTIAARLGEAKTQAVLFKEAGIDMVGLNGEMMPITTVLEQLAVRWQNLTDVQRASVADAVAGVRQQNILYAYLQNMGEIHTREVESLKQSGHAAADAALQVNTLAGAYAQLKAQMEAIATQQGGSADWLKSLVGALKEAAHFWGAKNAGDDQSEMQTLREKKAGTNPRMRLLHQLVWLSNLIPEDEFTPDDEARLNMLTHPGQQEKVSRNLALLFPKVFGTKEPNPPSEFTNWDEGSETPNIVEVPGMGGGQRGKDAAEALEKLSRGFHAGAFSADEAATKFAKLKKEFGDILSMGGDASAKLKEHFDKLGVTVDSAKLGETRKEWNEQWRVQEKIIEAQSKLDTFKRYGRNAGSAVETVEEKQRELQAKKSALESQTPASEEAANERLVALRQIQHELSTKEKELAAARLQDELKALEVQQKKNDQLQRELGMLSDEDMLKARILSGEMKRGEIDKNMSIADFVNLPQKDRRLLQMMGVTPTGMLGGMTLGGAADEAGAAGVDDAGVRGVSGQAGGARSLLRFRGQWYGGGSGGEEWKPKIRSQSSDETFFKGAHIPLATQSGSMLDMGHVPEGAPSDAGERGLQGEPGIHSYVEWLAATGASRSTRSYLEWRNAGGTPTAGSSSWNPRLPGSRSNRPGMASGWQPNIRSQIDDAAFLRGARIPLVSEPRSMLDSGEHVPDEGATSPRMAPVRPPATPVSMQGQNSDALAASIAREVRMAFASLFPLPIRDDSGGRIANSTVAPAGTARGRARSA